MKNYKSLLIKLICNANKILVDSKKELLIYQKNDLSPVTSADLKVNDYLNQQLSLTKIPIISEENSKIPFFERKNFKEYWLIDPLDGTKEFINGSPDYSVNIALIRNNKPIIGIISCPEKNTIYYGDTLNKILEKYKIENGVVKKIDFKFNKSNTFLVSNSHISSEKKILENKYNNFKLRKMGSSLKFCHVATGEFKGYYRCGPTMEWDIAAGVALCESVGLKVKIIGSDKIVCFNKEDLKNKGFYVSW